MNHFDPNFGFFFRIGKKQKAIVGDRCSAVVASVTFTKDSQMFGQPCAFGKLSPVFDQHTGSSAVGDEPVLDHCLDSLDDRSRCHICFADRTGQVWLSKTTGAACQEQKTKSSRLPMMSYNC